METLIQNPLLEKINDLNLLILQGKIMEAFEKYYAEEIIMQENEDDLRIGKKINRKHEEAFSSNITEFRSAEVKNVIVSDNLTVVEWDFDFTHKDWGDRKFTQIAVQRWNNQGQIINEKFYYNN